MKKLEVGDTVRIKKRLVVGKSYGGLVVMGAMPFVGERVIRQVDGVGSIMLRNNPFYYRCEMLVLISKAKHDAKEK